MDRSEPKHKSWHDVEAKAKATRRFQVFLHNQDYKAIQKMILDSGLNGYMRYKLWMQVLNVNKEEYQGLYAKTEAAMAHVNEIKNGISLRVQLDKDIERSFHYERAKYGKDGFNFTKHGRRLLLIMSSALGEDHSWEYFQGFHDICTVLLRVMGLRGAMLAAPSMARRYFLPLLQGPLLDQRVFGGLREFTKQILRRSNPQVYELVSQPGWRFTFQIPWIMTWLSHYSFKVEPLFDLLLLHPPIFICYLSASLISNLIPRLDFRASEPCELEAQFARRAEFLDANSLNLIMQSAVEMEAMVPPLLVFQQQPAEVGHLQTTIYGQLNNAPIPATSPSVSFTTPTIIMMLIVLISRLLQGRLHS